MFVLQKNKKIDFEIKKGYDDLPSVLPAPFYQSILERHMRYRTTVLPEEAQP